MLPRLLIIGVLLATGCVFDSSGPAYGPAGDTPDARPADRNRGEFQDPWPPPDLKPDRPVPDMAPLDRALYDRKRGDRGPPDTTLLQGATCADPRVSFKASTAPSRCAKLSIQVRGSTAFTWVMVGASAAGSTAAIAWQGKAKVGNCKPDYCWDFKSVPVPCADGPYTFHFMKDATGDDPKKGRIVGSCRP